MMKAFSPTTLTDGWTFASSNAGTRFDHSQLKLYDWLEARVPGAVQFNLYHLGLIPDPYLDDQFRQLAWIETRDWWYRCSFEAPVLGPGFHLQLVCSGLDTIADIYLNGNLLGNNQNMWVPFIAELDKYLVSGSNEVLIHFPALKSLLSDGESWWGTMRKQVGASLRKCQCGFGWDFVPRLPTIGVWRPVELRVVSGISLRDMRVSYDLSCEQREALVTLEAEVENLRTSPCRAEFTWTLQQDNQNLYSMQTAEQIAPGTNIIQHSFPIQGIYLWWPVGHGEQPLYEGVISTQDPETKLIHTSNRRFGFRTVQLLEEPDEKGRSCYFNINGQGIFCWGANLPPTDLLSLESPQATIDHLLHLTRQMHMNMLRVWGGGIYFSDYFYDRCDELGLLVWQDFMFACSAYPDHDTAFLENVRQEAKWVARSLRHHPSLICWCGNNENEWIFSRNQASNPTGERMAGSRIFTEVLPEVIACHDGTRPYRQSTPFGGERPNSPHEGTQHYYSVGFGVNDDGSFDFHWPVFGPQAYKDNPGRFIAEFGAYVGIPEPESIERFLSPGQRAVESIGWKAHLPYIGHWPVSFQDMFDHQMSQLFGVLPQALGWEEYLKYARLVQGECLRQGFEAFRRNKPFTSGALMWCLVGIWPSTDYSLIDFEGFPKPAYYYVKRALSPVLVSIVEDGNDISVWAVNDGLSPLKGSLQIEFGNLKDGARWQEDLEVEIPNEKAIRVKQFSPGQIPLENKVDGYMAATLWLKTERLSRAEFLPASARMTCFPEAQLSLDLIHQDDQKAIVRIRSDAFAYAVRLHCYRAIFDDNYFQLLPRETRLVGIDLRTARSRVISLSALNSRQPVQLKI
jgi:beta-mannosidase